MSQGSHNNKLLAIWRSPILIHADFSQWVGGQLSFCLIHSFSLNLTASTELSCLPHIYNRLLQVTLSLSGTSHKLFHIQRVFILSFCTVYYVFSLWSSVPFPPIFILLHIWFQKETELKFLTFYVFTSTFLNSQWPLHKISSWRKHILKIDYHFLVNFFEMSRNTISTNKQWHCENISYAYS
jgi:hypothetical protein